VRRPGGGSTPTVLMGNHYHLLLETPQANLVAGMKWLQGTYTQRFNARHKLRGHLFQGRYKALNVDGEDRTHFQVVSTYIHLNPVRAGLVGGEGEALPTYRWSSYPAYLLAPRKRPPWLCVDRVLGSLGFRADDAEARRGYEAYMEGRVVECRAGAAREVLEAEWDRIRSGWYLGEADFRERLLAHLGMGSQSGQRQADSVSGQAARARGEQAAEQWVQQALRSLNLDDAALHSLPKGADAKLVMAWWLRRQTTVSRRWIAERLGMGHDTRVTLAVRVVSAAKAGRLERLRRLLGR